MTSEDTNRELANTRPTRAILQKALLAGLANLIPVPFIDEMVKHAVQRSLVRDLAKGRTAWISTDDVKTLADDEDVPLWRGLMNKAAFMPVRWVLRRAVVVFTIKSVVDATSDVLHRAVLVDYALASRAIGPGGSYDAKAVRRAIDVVCKEIRTGPVEQALQNGLEPTKEALVAIADAVRRQLAGGGSVQDAAERGEKQLGATVAALWQDLAAVPQPYFDDMIARFDRALGR